MCTLHLIENGVNVGFEAGRINVGNSDRTSVPIEAVDGLKIYGKPLITTYCIEECMKKGIPISFFSSTGGYIGGFTSTYINVKRQRIQSLFNSTYTSFVLAKKIIYAKVINQLTVLRRYNRTSDECILDIIKSIKHIIKKIDFANDIHQLMGYEGIAARYYFEGLSRVVKKELSFSGRSKCPPKDHFNALLSFGYSLLYNEMYGVIVNRGLNPYFGFIHEDKENHPALVSDMIEEWRAVIVDSMVMSLINGNEISLDDFEVGKGFYLNNIGRKKVINKYNKKMDTKTSYILNNQSITYRKALDYQIQSLVHVIEEDDAFLYSPIMIR